MVELRHIVVLGVRSAAFQISNFLFCGLALPNIFTKISGNIGRLFFDSMKFSKISVVWFGRRSDFCASKRVYSIAWDVQYVAKKLLRP